MRAQLFAAAVVSTTLTITSASATVLISGDNGGLMEHYTARFQQVRQSREPVVIDGARLFGLHHGARPRAARSNLRNP